MDVTYQIVTNLSCNLDCTYCYERKFPRNNRVQDVIDFIHACFDRDKGKPGIDGAIIDIIGGEPFLQPKLLIAAFETAEILAKRDNRAYVFSISTNGTLFDKPLNREIIERWYDRLSIGVSLDGLPEEHDKFRIFTTSRKGSFEKAMEGYNYLKSMKIYDLGIKATFTLATLPRYAESMKFLVDASGGGTIYGNVVFEDILPRQMALGIANQMIDVLQHWIDKGMHLNQNNEMGHISPRGMNIDRLWDPEWREKLLYEDSIRYDEERLRPHCGTTVYMTCLGFDRNIYGCNRFMSTVTTRQAIGKLVGQEIINTDGGQLLKEVKEQWKSYPETCIGCPAKQMCGSCVAAAYENGDGEEDARKQYHAERRQCGWTTAKLLVGQWWAERFGDYNDQFEKRKCDCYSCRHPESEKPMVSYRTHGPATPGEVVDAVFIEPNNKGAKNEIPANSQFYEA